jgi:hypothetical protein
VSVSSKSHKPKSKTITRGNSSTTLSSLEKTYKVDLTNENLKADRSKMGSKGSQRSTHETLSAKRERSRSISKTDINFNRQRGGSLTPKVSSMGMKAKDGKGDLHVGGGGAAD